MYHHYVDLVNRNTNTKHVKVKAYIYILATKKALFPDLSHLWKSSKISLPDPVVIEDPLNSLDYIVTLCFILLHLQF